MLYTVETNKDLETVSRDLQAAITKRSFGVLAIHDLKAAMAKKGIDFDQACLIFEVCNPQQAKEVLEKNMEISTALPCRISVFQDGDRVKISTLKPTVLLNLFGQDDLQSVAEEVEHVMLESMDEAVG